MLTCILFIFSRFSEDICDIYRNKKTTPNAQKWLSDAVFPLERKRGIEPPYSAWEAGLFCGYFGFVTEFFRFVDLHVDLHPKDNYLTYPYCGVCVLHRDGYIFSKWLLHLHAPFARMPVPHLLPQNT